MDIEKELINDLAGIRGAIETQEGIYIPLEEVKKLLRNRIQQVKNSCLDGVSVLSEEEASNEASKVFMSITGYSPLTHIGGIERSWIEACITRKILEISKR